MATGSYSAGSFAIPRRCSLPREPMLTGLWGILWFLLGANAAAMDEAADVTHPCTDAATETADARFSAIVARCLLLITTGWHGSRPLL